MTFNSINSIITIRSSFPSANIVNANKGFTLIESLISVTVLAILIGLSTVTYAEIVSSNRAQATTSDLVHSLALARMHSIASGRTVIICPKSSNQSVKCVSKTPRYQNWNNGWMVFRDDNSSKSLDPNEHIIFDMSDRPNLQIIFNQAGLLRFFSDGSSRSAGFYICQKDKHEYTHLMLLHTGRTRLKKNASFMKNKRCGLKK